MAAGGERWTEERQQRGIEGERWKGWGCGEVRPASDAGEDVAGIA